MSKEEKLSKSGVTKSWLRTASWFKYIHIYIQITLKSNTEEPYNIKQHMDDLVVHEFQWAKWLEFEAIPQH